MKMSCHTFNCPAVLVGGVNKNKTQYRTRSNPSAAAQISSATQPTDESGKSLDSKRVMGSAMAIKRYQAPNSLLSQPNTVGIIGGVSVFSTLIFLEKLVRWSSKDGQECVPFVVCNDPGLSKEIPVLSSFHSFKSRNSQIQFNHGPIVGNLQRKRVFLEQSGASCIVMPCHLSHAWYGEISKGCSLPFLHIGECVARELSNAKMKPLEAGSNVRIGVLATDATSVAAFYQEKLQAQLGQIHRILLGPRDTGQSLGLEWAGQQEASTESDLNGICRRPIKLKPPLGSQACVATPVSLLYLNLVLKSVEFGCFSSMWDLVLDMERLGSVQLLTK